MATGFSVFVNIGAKIASSVGASIGKVEGQFAAMGRKLKMHSLEANLAVKDGLKNKFFEAAAAGWALERALAAPIKAAVEFESAMADVRKVVDFPTPQAFTQMGKDLVDMSLRLPMSADGLAKITAAAGQAGIAGKELLPFTEMAAKVGVAFDISAGEAGDALAKLRTALQLSNPQVGSLTDAMNKLSNEQASTASGILDVVRRVGVQGKSFGFTAVQTSAFASAMLSAGTESEVAAVSFQNMGLALTKGAAATGGQKKAFKALGLDATKTAKSMQKDAVGTTLSVMEKLSKLPKYMQAGVASQLFGNEAKGLNNLLGNIDLLKSSLAMVAKESDYAGSSTAEFEARAKTTANNIQLFKNHVEALGMAIGTALLPSLNSGMAALQPLARAMAAFASANPRLVAGLVGAASAMVAFRVASIGLKFAAAFGKAAVLDLALGLWRVAAASKAIVLLPLTMMRGAAVAALSPMRALAGAMRLVRLAFVSTGVGALLVGLATAGTFIYNNWSGIGRFFESFGAKLKESLGPGTIAAFQPIIDAGASLLGIFQNLTGEISGDKWAAWGSQAGASVKGFAADIASIATTITAISDAFSRLNGGSTDMFANTQREFASLKAGWDFMTKPLDFGPAIASMNSFVSQGAAAITNYDWAGVGTSIVNGIIAGVGSMAGALAGKLGEMASGAAEKVRGMFSFGGAAAAPPTVAQQISKGMPPLAGARALGGPVRFGSPYLVGESGPEIFVPTGAGRIETNQTFGRLAAASRGGGQSAALRGSARSAVGQAGVRQGGDIHFSLAVNSNGGDAREIVRLARSTFRDELRRLQREQRGNLND